MALPNKMQALIVKNEGYTSSAKPEGIQFDSMEPWLANEEVALPEVKSGQVMIKMTLANINPSDLHFLKGEYGQPRIKGAPAGFEGIGEVVGHDAGDRGEQLMGKRVTFIASADGSGSWSEYATTSIDLCIPVLDDLRDEDGAGLVVNPITAIAMFDIVKKSGSKSFVITAAGSQLGKLLIGLGAEAGIDTICIVRRDEYIEPLKALGATEVLSSSSDSFIKDFQAVSRALKPRIMLDAVSDQISSNVFLNMPNHSRWIIYGKLSPDPVVMDALGQLVFTGKKIEGFWLTPWLFALSTEDRIAVYIDAQKRFIDGRWHTPVRDKISLSEAIEKLPDALNKLNTGKVMIAP